MAEELWQTLLRFHWEAVKPELREEMNETIDSRVGVLEHRMNSHFETIFKRFDRIESELMAVKGGVQRLSALEGH